MSTQNQASKPVNDLAGNEPAQFVIDKFVIHVGPHKTGTTSIQKILCDFSDELEVHGWLYPKPPAPMVAHHFVPFFLMGWDLKTLLGMDDSKFELNRVMINWLTRAKENDFKRIIISAEDFSLLSNAQWDEFFRAIDIAQQETRVLISDFQVTYTQRSMDERVESLSIECLKHGSPLDEDELKSLLLKRCIAQDDVIHKLPLNHNQKIKISVLDYKVQNGEQSFISFWIESVLGQESLTIVDESQKDLNLNARISKQSQVSLRAFNALNTPLDGDLVLPFNILKDVPPSTVEARKRLEILVNLAIEQDLALAEVSRLHELVNWREHELEIVQSELAHTLGSFSWRVTRFLRYVRGLKRAK